MDRKRRRESAIDGQQIIGLEEKADTENRGLENEWNRVITGWMKRGRVGSRRVEIQRDRVKGGMEACNKRGQNSPRKPCRRRSW